MGTVTIRWVEGLMMVGTDSVGHSVVIGRSPQDKETFVGLKASDLLLISAAACSVYDVIEILTKQREPLEHVTVFCSGDQLSDPPYTFTKVHLHYQVKGAVDEKKLARAIELSEDKYCSVISTLRLGIPVTSDYEIVA